MTTTSDYAYVSDESGDSIYAVDIRPGSETYHEVTRIELNSADVKVGLRQLDISSDGKRLYVAAPNRFLGRDQLVPHSRIFVVNVDPEDVPDDPNNNQNKWHEKIAEPRAIRTFSRASQVGDRIGDE